MPCFERTENVKNKKNLYIMYAIALLQGMVFYSPIAALYREARGLSVFHITLIESISYLLCIALELPWGVLADRIGYKKTMCICSVVYFASKLVFWRADSFGLFLLERVLLSIVVAGLSGVDVGILYLSCPKGESQKAFGIFNAMGSAGLLTAALVFSLFISENYGAAALLTAAAYGAAMVLSFFLTEVKGEEKPAFDPAGFKEIFLRTVKNRRLVMFLVAVAFITQTHQTLGVFLNQMQYESCGLSPAAIGFVYIAVMVAGTLGALSHKLTRRLGVKRASAALYAAAFAACLLLGFTNSGVLSVLGILVLNLANSFFQPLQTRLQNNQVLSPNRATELSVYAILIDCVSAGTSAVFGALAKAALELSFFFGAVLCAAGLLLFCLWYKGQPREEG